MVISYCTKFSEEERRIQIKEVCDDCIRQTKSGDCPMSDFHYNRNWMSGNYGWECGNFFTKWGVDR
jgi:hypothetical protein